MATLVSMMILGHRGIHLDDDQMPYQNSLNAFEQALSCADGFETDAVVSVDGTVFLIHETTSEQGRVCYAASEHLNAESAEQLGLKRLDKLTAEAISQFRLKDGQPIPRLTDAIALFTQHPDKILNIEIKGIGCEAAVVEILKAAIAKQVIQKQQIIVSSFNHDALIFVRNQLPDIKIGMLFIEPGAESVAMFPQTVHSARYTSVDMIFLMADKLAMINPHYVIMSHLAASETLLVSLKKLNPNLNVLVWEYSELKDEDIQSRREHFDLLKQQSNFKGIIVDDPKQYR